MCYKGFNLPKTWNVEMVFSTWHKERHSFYQNPNNHLNIGFWNLLSMPVKAKNSPRTQIFENLPSLCFITRLLEFFCNGRSSGLIHLPESILEVISWQTSQREKYTKQCSEVVENPLLNNRTVEVKHRGTCTVYTEHLRLVVDSESLWETSGERTQNCVRVNVNNMTPSTATLRLARVSFFLSLILAPPVSPAVIVYVSVSGAE